MVDIPSISSSGATSVMKPSFKRHVETFLPPEQLGSQIPPYRPNYAFPGPFIDTAHRRLAETRLKDDILIQVKNRRWLGSVIRGWLRREDALKLYELSYFSPGDILELGSHRGLSTSILSSAVKNAGRTKHVYTVDLNHKCVRATKYNLRWMGLHRDVTVMRDDAIETVKRFATTNKRFSFIFIDHSHEYDPVYAVCRELVNITTYGALCLFHDYNDMRNGDPENIDYGVYQAVIDGLDSRRFEFVGIYGCAALYRVT